MKNQKGSKESEINHQLIAGMERDLGINQDEPEEKVSKKLTPPPRPAIPFHSVGSDSALKKQLDATTELYDMYQLSKQLAKTGS